MNDVKVLEIVQTSADRVEAERKAKEIFKYRFSALADSADVAMDATEVENVAASQDEPPLTRARSLDSTTDQVQIRKLQNTLDFNSDRLFTDF